jgi:hypothetical protein
MFLAMMAVYMFLQKKKTLRIVGSILEEYVIFRDPYL